MRFYLIVAAVIFASANQSDALSQESTERSAVRSGDQRIQQSQLFHRSAVQGTGLLIPLYSYPENIHTNATFNRLIELKRRFERIPFWVIVNPGSGPGPQADANYVKAIDRLIGSGCTVLAYVSTDYAKRPIDDVAKDMLNWQKFYPRIQGLFFDEMVYENDRAKVAHQSKMSKAARVLGYWPIVCNPGADTPEPYFAADVADVIIVHEGASWPEENRLHGNYFGGHADYPPWTRGVLVHSMPELHQSHLSMIRRYARWVYVTEDKFTNQADNPWDTLSKHVEALCQQIEAAQK